MQVARLQTPRECGAARYLACTVEGWSCGFGCQMHSLTDCMTTALLHNRTAVLLPAALDRYGPECGSAWGCFFLPLSACDAHAAAVPPAQWALEPGAHAGARQYVVYRSWGEDPYRVPAALEPLGHALFAPLGPRPSPACLLGGVLLRWCLRLSPRMRRVLDERRRELGLDAAATHAGVHVRRTDKVGGHEAQACPLAPPPPLCHVPLCNTRDRSSVETSRVLCLTQCSPAPSDHG